MAIDLQELNSLIDDPANVSMPVKALAILAICGLVLFMGYKLIIVDKMSELDGLMNEAAYKAFVEEEEG